MSGCAQYYDAVPPGECDRNGLVPRTLVDAVQMVRCQVGTGSSAGKIFTLRMLSQTDNAILSLPKGGIPNKEASEKQDTKSFKMVLDGNNGHRPMSPMADLDKVTLTKLANDLFRRLQSVEEQRREAQSLVSQQTKKIKNLENTLEDIVKKKDEHHALMAEFFGNEMSWSRRREEKIIEDKKKELERVEWEMEAYRKKIETERQTEEKKYAELMLAYLEQEGAARMLNMKIQRMRERKEQRKMAYMTTVVGLLEEMETQNKKIVREAEEALERRREGGAQTDVTMATPARDEGTQTDLIQYNTTSTETFTLVNETADKCLQTSKSVRYCAQTQTVNANSTNGQTQTDHNVLSPGIRPQGRRSSLKMGTGGTYFRHLQETVVFPSTAKHAQSTNSLDFCSKYIITPGDAQLVYCPPVHDPPQISTPIEVKVYENNNYIHDTRKVEAIQQATPIIARQHSPVQATPKRSPEKCTTTPSNDKLPITDTCKRHRISPSSVQIVHIGKNKIKMQNKIPRKLTRMFCWKRQI